MGAQWLGEHYSVDLVGSTVIVIIGLVVLVAAVMVGLAGVLANGGVNHALTENFAVFGYHVTGSTGLLSLYGIVVGAAVMVGLSLLLAGAPLHPPLSTTRETPEPTALRVATDSTFLDSATDRGTATPPATRAQGAACAHRTSCSLHPWQRNTRGAPHEHR